jgi:hypothetical protein
MMGLIYRETADTAQQETAACNTKHMGIPAILPGNSAI